MKKVITALLLLFASLFQLQPAQAAESLVFNNSTTCNSWGPGTITWAYRMYAASAATVSALEVPYLTTSNVSATTLALYSSSGGAPGTLLGTFTYSSLTGSTARYTGTANLSVGDFYWVYYATTTTDPCSAGTQGNTAGTGWTMSQYRYQGASGGGPFTYDSVGTTASMLQLKIYSTVPDTTPPTFPSTETFTVAENQTSVGSIKASESATISIYGGQDQNKFSLTQSDSTTASLTFASAPNFESPTDFGTDNTYQVVLRALDTAGNAGYETVTASVTDVDENAKLLSYTFSGNQTKGQTTTLVATVNVSGKVRFLANGKRIPGCINVSTVGSGPITATCLWKSALRGRIALSFTVTPSASNYFATTSQPTYLIINRRVNTR